ncbi:MAG: hypothetical protein QNJ97_10710 [Myxococcota bacterium]|nr:hypothetical protein [Myxococcota bacterium]
MPTFYSLMKTGQRQGAAQLAGLIFFVLGRAFQFASRFDPDVKEEIKALPEGFTLVMNILPNGPGMAIEKLNDRLVYLGGDVETGDVVMTFKNMASAMLMLTPQQGVGQATAERRFVVKGDISYGMIFTRCLTIVLGYLYPAIIAKRQVKRLPPMPPKKQFLRAMLYLIGIPTGV